ncbi:MAG: hypothetical protein RIB45_08025 [Marivibrio sp.]|uniref:hypothetical protein n=1 Tax=Marivibrio sp. TaxID=2039719 RepID=UPI0032EAE25E
MFDFEALLPLSAHAAAFLRCWMELTVAGILPRRYAADARIRGVERKALWLYARNELGRYEAVFLGGDVQRAWNAGADAASLDALMGPGAACVAARFDYCLREKRLIHSVSRTAAKPWLVAERIYGPVTDASGAPRYIFGATDYERHHVLECKGVPPLSSTFYETYDPITRRYLGPMPTDHAEG